MKTVANWTWNTLKWGTYAFFGIIFLPIVFVLGLGSYVDADDDAIGLMLIVACMVFWPWVYLLTRLMMIAFRV